MNAAKRDANCLGIQNPAYSPLNRSFFARSYLTSRLIELES